MSSVEISGGGEEERVEERESAIWARRVVARDDSVPM